MPELTEVVGFARGYLALFFTFVAVFYTVRVITKQRTEGRDLIFPGNKYCPSWWNHMLFRGFRVAIWLVCVMRWFFPTVDNYLGMLNFDSAQAAIILAGLVLLTGGFTFTIVMHFQMGSQWRSGIDTKHKGALITQGIFRFSRNPMFLGVALAQIGFMLALPSVFSMVCLVVGITTLHRQVKEEEKHLLQRFGSEYSEYQANVRRWL